MGIGEKCSCPAGTSFNDKRNGHCLKVANHQVRDLLLL